MHTSSIAPLWKIHPQKNSLCHSLSGRHQLVCKQSPFALNKCNKLELENISLKCKSYALMLPANMFEKVQLLHIRPVFSIFGWCQIIHPQSVSQSAGMRSKQKTTFIKGNNKGIIAFNKGKKTHSHTTGRKTKQTQHRTKGQFILTDTLQANHWNREQVGCEGQLKTIKVMK